MGLRRLLKPSILLRRKALRAGVFGGDKKWLSVFVTMFIWKRIKALFGFGDPQPVMVEDIEPGQRFVVAHEPSTSRRKKRKVKKKAKKSAKKAAAKSAKSAAKAAKAAARS